MLRLLDRIPSRNITCCLRMSQSFKRHSKNTVTFFNLQSTSVRFVSLHSGTVVNSSESLTESTAFSSLDTIPAAPIIPETVVEPSLASLGLCNYTPAGLVQKCLELLHIDLGFSWGTAIVVLTVIVRFSLLPLTIYNRNIMTELTKSTPRQVELHQRMTQARHSGNMLEMMRLSQETEKLMLTSMQTQKKLFGAMLCQSAVAGTMFWGLRSLALTVPSLKSGGFLWFSNLAVGDPFYILPFFTSIALFGALRMGTSEVGVSNPASAMANKLNIIMPIGIFPFVCFWPASMQLYWAVGNSVSLCIGLMFRFNFIPNVNLLEDEKASPVGKYPKKSFTEGFMESINNARFMLSLNREKVIKEWAEDDNLKKPKVSPHRRRHAEEELEKVSRLWADEDIVQHDQSAKTLASPERLVVIDNDKVKSDPEASFVLVEDESVDKNSTSVQSKPGPEEAEVFDAQPVETSGSQTTSSATDQSSDDLENLLLKNFDTMREMLLDPGRHEQLIYLLKTVLNDETQRLKFEKTLDPFVSSPLQKRMLISSLQAAVNDPKQHQLILQALQTSLSDPRSVEMQKEVLKKMRQ